MTDLNAHLTGPNALFLRKHFLVRKLFEQMESNLVFTGKFNAQPIDSRSVILTKEPTNKGSDPKKVWPAKLTESADWPGVTISPIYQESAMLQKYGFELRVGEDLLKLTEGKQQIMRAIDRTGFWMAQFREAKIAENLIADGTALGGDWEPSADWSDPLNANYFQDLIKFKRLMRKPNKSFEVTDIYLNTTDYNDLELWVLDVNADPEKRRQIGTTTVGENSLFIPALKSTVHRIDEGVEAGRILGIDGRNNFATYYYYNDPGYGTKSVTFNTKEGQKTVPGLGLNIYQYFDNDQMEIVNKLWFDFVFAVEDKDGAITDDGL